MADRTETYACLGKQPAPGPPCRTKAVGPALFPYSWKVQMNPQLTGHSTDTKTLCLPKYLVDDSRTNSWDCQPSNHHKPAAV